MKQRPFRWLPAGILLLLIVLPLIGVAMAGRPIGPYLEFPPLTRDIHHAGFERHAFTALAVFILALILPFEIRATVARTKAPRCEARSRFPWWGWTGLLWTAAAWVLAWTRFAWFAPLQPFTFTPLWLGYVVIVNALTQRLTGQCMLRNRPVQLLCLAVISSVFWWFFEYLNRFVQNWYYLGASFRPTEYVLFATFPFSTVLPAVLGTYELLDAVPRVGAGLDTWLRVRMRHPGRIALMVFIVATAGLAGIGIWPDYLFPLLWIAPLCVVTSVQTLLGRETIFSPLAGGRWREIYCLALAALICGGFWEMWNFYSAVRWVYQVPFVDWIHVFEMPVLGYAGYLPFGLECAVVADLCCRGWRQPPHER
jgi:hypothetical protein